MWAQKDLLEPAVEHLTADVAVVSSYRPLLFLVWLKKPNILNQSHPEGIYLGIANRAEDFDKLTMQLLSWQKGGSKVVT